MAGRAPIPGFGEWRMEPLSGAPWRGTHKTNFSPPPESLNTFGFDLNIAWWVSKALSMGAYNSAVNAW